MTREKSNSMQGSEYCPKCGSPKRYGTALKRIYACKSVYHKPTYPGGFGTYLMDCDDTPTEKYNYAARF